MSGAVVLFWLGTSAAQASFEPELDSWARARWVKLAEPAEDAPAGLAYDERLVAKLEELVDQARLAASSLDDATAKERLAEIQRALKKHPELPQAAWLLAEALQVEAGIALRTAPEERTRLIARAAALEGRRAPAFGETGEATAEPTVTVSLSAERPGDRIFFDGERVGPKHEAVPGEHHVRVVRRERVIWAGWVDVSAAGALRLPLPRPVPCSPDDLEGVTIRGERVRAPRGVACGRWALARPAAGGGIEIASCSGSSCGPLVVWKRHYGAVYEGPPQPAPEPGFPAWASWALAGAGVAALGAGVLWQAGAFDDPAPGKTRFEFYGPRQGQALSASARARR